MEPNSTLSDVFRSILETTNPRTSATSPPAITINGNGNVLAWGGTVNLRQAAIGGQSFTQPEIEP